MVGRTRRGATASGTGLPVRTQQKLDTRERVRKAAFELFRDQGFEATTTKAIAARAGVAAGTVFVHAADKDDLLFLVMHDELAGAVDAQMATLPAGTLLDQLLHVFGGIYRMYGRHPEMSRQLVRALPGARGPNAERVNALTFAFLHRVAGMVRDHQARGAIDPAVEPLLLAQNVFALYFFALLGWLSGMSTLETALDPHLRMALELQLRGLVR